MIQWLERRVLGSGSLFKRAVLANAVVMALAFALLVVTPVEVSAPIRLIEAAILAAGIATLFAINLLLLRRALAPLNELAARMEAVDLRDPDRVTLIEPASYAELAAFSQAFEGMLDRLAAERREGARAALVAQERERERIARALHDEAGQMLTAVTLEIERAAEDQSRRDREQLEHFAAQLQAILVEIRRLVRELRPEALGDLGLVNALIALTNRLTRQTGITIERHLGSDLPGLPPDAELVIYRIAQEALTNVLRHSGAEGCSLSLQRQGDAVVLEVRDDGRGFDPASDADNEGIGVEGMRERAMLVGGRLEVRSRPGAGTTIRLEVSGR